MARPVMFMIQYSCPGCSTELESKEQSAGKKVKCPNCATSFVVPHQSRSAALLRAKTFGVWEPHKVQDEMNRWLRENQNIEIVSMTQSGTAGGNFAVTLLYRLKLADD
jgi:DNA-directed RNA polymerase subunit RPC12/RpoP